MRPDDLRAAEVFRVLGRMPAPVSSEELAARLGISPRTVKGGMESVRRFAEQHGARLASRRGVGYWLDVLDRAALDAAIIQIEVQLAGSPNRRWTGIWRQTEILQWVLAQDRVFPLSELAAAVYSSVGTLRQEIPALREYLSGYDLDLAGVRGEGYQLVGPEFNRRWCMVSLLASPYHHAESLYQEQPASPYLFDHAAFNDLRHELLEVLRTSHTRLMDEHSQMVAQYLYLTLSRRDRDHPLELDEEDLAFVSRFPQFGVADRVLSVLGRWHSFEAGRDAEVVALAKLLLILGDVTPVQTPATGDDDLHQQVSTMAAHVAKALTRHVGLPLWESGAASDLLEAGLTSVVLRARLGWGRMGPVSTVLHHDRLGSSPIAEGLSHVAARELETRFGIKVGDAARAGLGSMISAGIASTRIGYRPRRVAVCTTSGLNGAAVLRDRMLATFGEQRFASIEGFELYELRGMAPGAFDVVVLDYPEFSYQYDWPHALLRQGWPLASEESFVEKVIYPGMGLPAVARRLPAPRVFGEFPARTRSELAQALALRFGRDPEDVSALLPLITAHLQGRTLGHALVVLLPIGEGVRTGVELFELAQPLSDRADREVTHVLCLSVDFDGDVTLLRLVEEFVHRICVDDGALASFVGAPTPDVMAAIAAPGLIGHATAPSPPHRDEAPPARGAASRSGDPR